MRQFAFINELYFMDEYHVHKMIPHLIIFLSFLFIVYFVPTSLIIMANTAKV